MKVINLYKFKQLIKITIFIFTLIILIFLSKNNFESVSTSTNMFFSNILPSLFPFIFFTEFILSTNIIDTISNLFKKYLNKFFKFNTNCIPAILIGFLCGYPMGAKSVAKLYEDKKISKSSASFLLCFVNNCNPVFIISTIGISILNNIKLGYILLIAHYVSAITIAIVIHKFKLINIIHENDSILNTFNAKTNKIIEKNLQFFDIIKKSILNSLVTLGLIFGFIVIFNLLFSIIQVYISMLNVNNNFVIILSSFFEVTKGCVNLTSANLSDTTVICMISFALGFSGLCILSQVYSNVYMHGFSFKLIIICKFFQGIISYIITYLILIITKANVIITPVFSNVEKGITYEEFMENIRKSYIDSTLVIIAGLCIYMIISIIITQKKDKTC